MKIGITGANGVIGSIIREKLSLLNFSFNSFSGDIRLRKDVYDWVENNQFDVILHFAALVPVNEVENNIINAYDINVGGIINLLSCLSNTNKKPWIFYSSTSHVYKSSNERLIETSNLEPITKYGFTKLMGEYILLDSSKCDFDVCIGRIFSFFHEKQIKPFLYPSILDRLKNEDLSKPFFLKGADDIRDIINADEVCNLIIKLMNIRATGIYNIASGEGIKIRDFVQSLTNKSLNIVTDENSTQSILVANIDKLNKVFNNYG